MKIEESIRVVQVFLFMYQVKCPTSNYKSVIMFDYVFLQARGGIWNQRGQILFHGRLNPAFVLYIALWISFALNLCMSKHICVRLVLDGCF